MNILIVDDEKSLRHIIKKYLSQLTDLILFEAESKIEAMEILKKQAIDIALVDIRLSQDVTNRDGQLIIKFIQDNKLAMPIVISSVTEIDEIKSAMKNGAFDYILKETLSREVLIPIIENLSMGIHNRILKQEIRLLRTRNQQDMSNNYIGISESAEKIRAIIKRYAFSNRPVLITGPTGSGKEVTAKQLHYFSEYPDEQMLSINCGALPANLIESQLFGYKKGAFTGANENYDGYLQAVGKGTLFLDEIAELPLELQPKLLRVLENNTFTPLGSTKEMEFKGRIVAATHANLESCIADKAFREDLFYRLNVLKIELPALSCRREDIPLLVSKFLKNQQRKMVFTNGAMNCLINAEWPGNIRQLRNVIDKIAILYDEVEITEEMVLNVMEVKKTGAVATNMDSLVKYFMENNGDGFNKIKVMEEALINYALESSQGNKAAAAKLLGIDRKVIYRRLESDLV